MDTSALFAKTSRAPKTNTIATTNKTDAEPSPSPSPSPPRPAAAAAAASASASASASDTYEYDGSNASIGIGARGRGLRSSPSPGFDRATACSEETPNGHTPNASQGLHGRRRRRRLQNTRDSNSVIARQQKVCSVQNNCNGGTGHSNANANANANGGAATIAPPSGGGGGCACGIENEVDPESRWYDRSDLIRFRLGAMEELEERINRQNLSNHQQELQRTDSSIPPQPREHQTQQGIDVDAMSFARRKHKAAILRCVVLFHKRRNARECVAALYRKLNKWNKDIALRDACLRYEEVYGHNNNTIGGGSNSSSNSNSNSNNGDHDSLPPRRWVSSTPPRLSFVKRRSATTEVCTPSLSSSSPPEMIMPNRRESIDHAWARSDCVRRDETRRDETTGDEPL
eukprot:CAMPEP_0172411116 /NCGR_PEP_ID=MMETSP1061-20121228/77232_1 /TAXON_ID=37318 /ORGANISM="Pseudo-nitzschia pungens, Strain cf. pungens" /LENGTH=400 /DNA_ID=CAMNT_0013147323 /DNA_START=518 /DNA_END=1722 /DNA_ORIENTATION=-